MHFKDLQLVEPLLRAVEAEGYTTPTPIQQQAIPYALSGRDVLGCAQTGTGKTAAFGLPILQRLMASKPAGNARPIRCLVLTPTRELANQIGESFATYGKFSGLTHTVIFGGVGQNAQEQALRRGIDILVATPGRLLDLMNQGHVSYNSLEIFVLDEADRMLDMGFIHDVKRVIAKLPKKRQTLFFSATMPAEITGLANSILSNPAKVEVTPVATTAETVEQKMYFVDTNQKRNLLSHLMEEPAIKRAIVFTRTKHGANRVAKHLVDGGVVAEAIHGNKSQNARERALEAFKDGTCRVLVATDIAARGIDIDGVTHVINFDLPNIPESYVHRIGRTGRAGARGIALSFCDGEERAYLKDIERTIRRSVPVVEHPYRPGVTPPKPPAASGNGGGGGERHGRSGGHGGGGHGPRRDEGRGGGGGGGGRRHGGGGRGGGGGGGRSGGGRSGGHGGGGARPAAASGAPAPAAAPRPARPSPKWF
ncbi:DEAD/DEAH box helicase [Aggregicoccus sp. 17bor-14]|uniref:DEAD/DEAH box helicase n=1 Tax=Myxococcaceae TaxID=31 RepID=UPI00129C2BF1|nr:MULTISPECIES: DEAD/DEAH box helicase [Myxococcaceae]MBF5044844.1 DEAD/DEAH box helicase [Simulacricoccus sp. 17bor-14]MRI90588.1 DEAD/DEAH box helicase [Aggregicoccus sp. 17bor-14]